ncbi:NAD(P)H-dependent flavin oxidoreductase [Zwartia vadi]|uniref:NAD(P)H-dependent flavin oxidoreductase n=1 Tax=Zwartia vadi TaxID=3058168 RepID=UPI0025B565D1|nr:nitronate monooxygenase [Zwartia vadi]MDN3986914.1 nitronate monooxygenase [Zwartia vadi]
MAFALNQLRVPIIQAPMAGGANTPALVAGVAQAGGMGSFGFAYSSPQKISDDLAAAKRLTSGPINANFFVFQEIPTPSLELQHQAVAALKRMPIAQDLRLVCPQPPFFPDLKAMLEPVWLHRPAVLSFHFGLPQPEVLERAKLLGIAVGVTATCLAEGQAIESAGADFVIAQGIEAGGHRGTFQPDTLDEDLATLALVRQLSATLRIPVVAAGGIMTGGDIARAKEAGASAAQMGTAFLVCDESGATPAHKHFLLTKPTRGTVFTHGFSGRRAQGLRNTFIEAMQGQPHLPFPLQNTLTTPLRQIAAQHDDGEHQSLWAGSAYAQARPMRVKDLMTVLEQEYLQHATARENP